MEKAKKALLIAYKCILLIPVFKVFFMSCLALFLNFKQKKQKFASYSYNSCSCKKKLVFNLAPPAVRPLSVRRIW